MWSKAEHYAHTFKRITMKRPRTKRLLKYALIGGCLLCLAAVAVGWFSFQYIPTWYAPANLNDDDLARVRASVARTYQQFTDRLAEGNVFQFTISARTLNEWIAARAALWPDLADAVPAPLTNAAVAFRNGHIILAATFERGRLKTVASAHLNANVRNGDIRVSLRNVATGAIGWPMKIVSEILGPRQSQLLRSGEKMGGKFAGKSWTDTNVESLDELRKGIVLENRLYWSNGRRYFRIQSIAAENDQLALVIEPIQ
jgi:hypothetical protein